MDSASSVFCLTKSQRTRTGCHTLNITCHSLFRNEVDLAWRPGGRSSKVPKLFGSFSGVKILSVSYGRRHLRPSNFTIMLLFVVLKISLKNSLSKQSNGRFVKVFGTFEKRAPGRSCHALYSLPRLKSCSWRHTDCLISTNDREGLRNSFKECASGENNMSEDARNLDVDVDEALKKACRVFPQQKKAIIST